MKTLNTLIHLLCALLIFLIVGTKVVVGQTWESNDIGLEAGNVAGQTSSVNDHTHSISGGGRGIEGSSDSFYFMSRQTLGDIELDVRITAFEGNEQAEAGLMIRQSLASDAVFAGVFINTLGEMHFKYRSETGDNVDILLGDVANPTNEIWLKIVYSGSIVAGYYSNDGINWDQVGLKSVQFSGFVKAGVVVTNGMPDALAEVACDHVQIIENVPQRLSKTVSGNAPSPILWLRSDWGVAHDDSKVTKWADYSGHANDATSTTPAGGVIDNRPLLVRDMMGLKPVIRFDNAGLSSLAERKFLRVEDRTSLNPDMVSIFVVSRWPSGQAGLAGMISKGGSSKGYTLGFKDNVLRLHIPTHVESFGAAVPANETYLVEGLFSTTSEPLSGLRVFVNAQQSPLPIPQRSAKISSNTFPLFIGQYLTSPSVTEPSSTQAYPFNGEIAEILIYNKVVPEFQRQRIEAYFKGKYNISGLPKPKLNQPTINQPGGIFDSSREVTISAQGSTIYYRANGGDVQIYAGPIVLPEGVTEIAAWTSHPGFTDSNIVAATYIVDTLSKYLSRQGLRLWLRSDAGIVKSNDGEIMEWRSQASSFSAQSGSTGKPLYIETGDAAINGKPSIEFNNDWLRVTASGDLNPLALNKHTICVVAQPSASIASSTSGTASAMVARHNTANGYWFGLWGTPATGGGVNLQMRKRLLLSSVSEVVQSPVNKAFAAGSWMALTTRFDLERNNLQSNGVDLFSANRTSAIGDSKTDLFIGAQSLSSGNPVVPFMGKIAEVIVFDRELSDDELREMNVYLNLRYQMQGTSLAPLVDLQTSPPAGLYAAEPTVLCTSKDDAQITYTVNDGEAIDYVDGINLAQFTGETVSVNVKRYRLKISAAKAGFNSVIDRSLTYFVDTSTVEIPRQRMKLWLRADLAATPATAPERFINRWNDQSGSGNHLISPASNSSTPQKILNALYGKPSISFGAVGLAQLIPAASTNQGLSMGGIEGEENTLNDVLTIFAVVKDNGSGDGSVIVERKTLDESVGYSVRLKNESNGNSVESKFDASVIKATQVQNSQPFLLPSGFNLIVQQVRADLPTSHSLGVNRTGSAIQHNIQTIPTTVARFFSLGARRRAQDQNPSSPSTMPDRGFNGEIAEMLVFDKALNAVEARRVEAYLIGRYSLNADSRVPLPELAMPNVTPESGMWQSGVTIEATHEESESVTLEYRYVWGDVMLAETPWSVYSESFPLVGVGPCTVQVRASKSGYKEAVKEFRLTIDPTVGSLPRQGMALWLAADKEIDLVYAGGDVPRTARWRDLSGNGNDAVPDVVNAGPDVINSSFIKYNTPGLAGSPAKALIFPNGNRRLIVKDAAELASATSIFVVTRSGLINDRIRVILQKLSSGVNGADGGWSISYHNITGRIGVSSLSTFDSPITVTGTQTNAAQLISLTANSMQVLGKTLDIQTGSFIPANNTGDDLYIGGSERFTFRATGTMGTDILSGINAADMPRLGAGMVINGSPVTGFLITEKISTSSVKLSRKVENASRTGNYGATSYMSGEIAEIIVYTGNLSASEVRDVQSYLMNKYEFAHKPALQSPLIQASPSGQSIGGVFTEGRTVSIIGEPGSTLYYRINDGEVQTANGNAVVTVGPGIDASSAAASIIAWSQKNGYAESAPSHAMILIDPDGALVPKADLKLWVRGDSSLTETSESAAVTRWLDLSGQGHHLTKPNVSSVGFPVKEEVEEFNGHPVVKFNSLGKTCLEGNYPGLDGENVSVFAIVRRPANFSTTVSVLAEKFTPLASAVDKGYSLQLINTESPKFNFRTRDTTIASTLTDTGRPCVLVGGTHADHAMNLNYQGNSVATKTFTTATKVLTGANPFYVGGRKAANNFDGEVAEIWVYDRAISQDEINRLSVYAHRRYGIQSNKQIPAPTANYEGGTFSVGLGVRLNCSISDVKIHYELGGEGQLDVPDPTENSPFFYPGDITGVISISGSLRVLKVVAKKPGLVDSDIKTWVYRIESGKSIVRRGLIAWFKSDRGVSVDPNLRVSRWSDQSGLGNDAVAPSAGASPYFVTDPQGATGLPVIRFNEAGLTAPLSLRIPHPLRYPGETSNFETMSVLAVTRKLGTNNSLLLKKGGYQLRLAGTATAPRGSLMVNGMTALTIPIRQNAFESITSTYDRVLRRISNGESMATANGTAAVTQDSNPLFIGSNVNTASSSNLQGEVAEIIIYNTGLSEAERQQMESYLRGNYGIYNPSLAIVSKPYFSPGGVTDGSVALDLPGRVAIVSQPGSVTYYTSDADLINAPSTSTWTRYTQPIYVGYTTTLAAFSRVEGLEPVNSAISLVTFELDELKYPGPVIDENDMTPPTVILEKPTNAVPITP